MGVEHRLNLLGHRITGFARDPEGVGLYHARHQRFAQIRERGGRLALATDTPNLARGIAHRETVARSCATNDVARQNAGPLEGAILRVQPKRDREIAGHVSVTGHAKPFWTR